MKKIAFDISQVIYGTGVSHYRANLIRNLLQIDKNNEYLLFGFSLKRKVELDGFKDSLVKEVDTKFLPIPQKILNVLWNRLHIVNLEKMIGKFDLVHTSDWLEPPSAMPKITTVHDVIPLKFSKMTPKSVVAVHKKKLFWVFSESKKVIVPSICTKDDLIELGLDEKKIVVIPEANNLEKQDLKTVEAVKRKYKIFGKYIISIGLAQRKNTKKIIDAFRLSTAGKETKLVIVGDTLGREIEHDRGVRYTGHINDKDLAALLTGSEVLVFPSLYEGLGVPVLDAFACETPVVTSNTSSLPEAAGDAAVLVDPTDTRSIAKGIEEALVKPKTLIAKGKKQLSKFSWKKCAEETLKVYEEVKQ